MVELEALPAESRLGPDTARWRRVLRTGADLSKRLAAEQAFVAAYQDLQAEAEEAVDGPRPFDLRRIERLDERLSILRAVAEHQGHVWKRVCDRVGHAMTASDSSGNNGDLPMGSSPEEVERAVIERLCTPVRETSYVVWLGTLAGPVPGDAGHQSVVAGPIAMCGIPCTGGLESWFGRARRSLRTAFDEAGRAVPPDVQQLGVLLNEGGWFSNDDIWGSLQEPASFVTRVEVAATSSVEARELALQTLRSVFGTDAEGLGRDIRPDARFWSQEAGWERPSMTARDHALGEVFAVGAAARAVRTWASDLETPIRADAARLVRRRALIHDPDALAEVRLTQALAGVEEVCAPQAPWNVLEQLCRRAGFDDYIADLQHLFDVVASRRQLAARAPAAGRSLDEVRAASSQLRELAQQSDYRDARVLADIHTALEAVHADALAPIWCRAMRERARRPVDDGESTRAHRAAVERFRRLRNLATHGAALPGAVYEPSAIFAARMFELLRRSVAEPAEGVEARFLGRLDREPTEAHRPASLEDVHQAIGEEAAGEATRS